MNIKEAVEESLRTKKMITRKEQENQHILMPTNDPFYLMAGMPTHLRETKESLLKGWQPMANDLIADDWYVTDFDYPTMV